MLHFFKKTIFFHLLFVAFVFGQQTLANDDKKINEIKREMVNEIIKAAPDLKIGAPSISDEQRNKLEDPEFSQFIRDFCPRMSYLPLKAKWDQNIKAYNEKMEIVKKKGAAAVNWRSLNLGQNSFVPLSSAPFENSRSHQVGVSSLNELKSFLDNRLREIYPQCDFKMTQKPQLTSQKIIQDRKLYLRDLARANPEQVLDSEMVELKIFEPVQAATNKSMLFINVVAHGYKIRFEAPGRNIIRKPFKIIFSVKILKSGYYLRDLQELNPDSRVSLPPSEIQRAKMDKYGL